MRLSTPKKKTLVRVPGSKSSEGRAHARNERPSSRSASRSETRTGRGREEKPAKRGAFGRPAGGTTATRKPAARRKPIKFIFKAPQGMKSCFLDFGFSTAKDGFMAPGATLDIIKGKWDNENAPRYDMFEHDPQTAAAFIARFNMLMYAANPAKRLPPNKDYQVIVRLSVSTKDGSMRMGVKFAWHSNPKRPDGDLIEFTDKKDPEYRRIRRTGKFLVGAMTKCVSLDALKEIERERIREQREAEKEAAREAKRLEREAAREAKAAARANGRHTGRGAATRRDRDEQPAARTSRSSRTSKSETGRTSRASATKKPARGTNAATSSRTSRGASSKKAAPARSSRTSSASRSRR